MAFSLCFGTFSLILGLKMSGQTPPKYNIVKSFHSTLNAKNWPHLLRNAYYNIIKVSDVRYEQVTDYDKLLDVINEIS